MTKKKWDKEKWVIATLSQREFRNGIQAIKDEVPIGKEYEVDLYSIQVLTNLVKDTGQTFPVLCIKARSGKYMPFDVLKFSEDIENAEMPPHVVEQFQKIEIRTFLEEILNHISVQGGSDFHKHKCPQCGVIWAHDFFKIKAENYTKAHTCQQCGYDEPSTEIYSGNEEPEYEYYGD